MGGGDILVLKREGVYIMPRRKTIKKDSSSTSSKTGKKKLKWVKPEICRVPLSQEQAVLSCCETPTRGMFDGADYICIAIGGCGAVPMGNYISS